MNVDKNMALLSATKVYITRVKPWRSKVAHTALPIAGMDDMFITACNQVAGQTPAWRFHEEKPTEVSVCKLCKENGF